MSVDVNKAEDLSHLFSRESQEGDERNHQESSLHQRLASLVFKWQSLREALKEPALCDAERLLYVRANVRTLHEIQTLLKKNPNAPREIRMLLSAQEIEQNWRDLCEQRHALFTLEVIKETESVEILLKRYHEFVKTESNPENNRILREKTVEMLARIFDRSLDVAGNSSAIRHATDIHLMIYLDNLDYLHNPKKFRAMQDLLGESLSFQDRLTNMIKGNTSKEHVEKMHGCLQGFLCLRRMLDDGFAFSFIVKTREVYERSLVLIKKAGYEIYGTSFYHALNATREQMFDLNSDLYSPFYRFRRPAKLPPPQPDLSP